jgi:hypothetical protein
VLVINGENFDLYKPGGYNCHMEINGVEKGSFYKNIDPDWIGLNQLQRIKDLFGKKSQRGRTNMTPEERQIINSGGVCLLLLAAEAENAACNYEKNCPICTVYDKNMKFVERAMRVKSKLIF